MSGLRGLVHDLRFQPCMGCREGQRPDRPPRGRCSAARLYSLVLRLTADTCGEHRKKKGPCWPPQHTAQSQDPLGNLTALPEGAAVATGAQTPGARPGHPGPCEGRVMSQARRAGAIWKLMQGGRGRAGQCGGLFPPQCVQAREAAVADPRWLWVERPTSCLLATSGTNLAQSHRTR